MQTNHSNQNNSIIKALDILECLNKSGKPLNPAQIAKMTGMSRQAVYRLLNSLFQRNWVIKDTQTPGSYRLGYYILNLATNLVLNQDIRKVARPYMEIFTHTYDESISLLLLDGIELVHFDRVFSSKSFQVYLPIGGRGPIYSKGAGKAIMAWMDEETIENIIRTTGLKNLTKYTLNSREELLKDIAETRERGYGVAEQEDVEGLRGVGSAIIGSDERPVGGLTVSGLCNYMTDERVEVLGRALAEVSRKISAELGFKKNNHDKEVDA